MRVIQLKHPAILDNLLSDMYVHKEHHARSTFSFEQMLALSSEILSYIMENKVVYYYLSNFHMLSAFVFGKYPFSKDTIRNMC